MKGHFSADGRYQTVWDSTTLGTLKECPRKYYYAYVCDWAPRAESPHLVFGNLLHKGREYYYASRAIGADHDLAVRLAIRQTAIDSWGWTSTHKTKDRYHLILALYFYLAKHSDDPLTTVIQANGKPAVELSFKLPIDMQAPDGETVLLSGHIDRMVEFQDSLWVTDLKSTVTTLGDKYFAQYSPDNQMSLYYGAGQSIFDRPIAGLIVDAVQVLADAAEFQRGFIHRSKGQLAEWLEDTEYYIEMSYNYASLYETTNKPSAYPMNDKACHNYGGCPFREVCARDPAIREAVLRTDFRKKIWDPTQNR